MCHNCNITTHKPGQALLLHSLSSTLTPEQLVTRPPMHERLLLDLPPPQLLLQPFQDPQLDQLASAATRKEYGKTLYVISLSNETHLDMCCCYTALSEFHLPSNQSHQRMSAAFQISLRHSSLCKYSTVPNLTR